MGKPVSRVLLTVLILLAGCDGDEPEPIPAGASALTGAYETIRPGDKPVPAPVVYYEQAALHERRRSLFFEEEFSHVQVDSLLLLALGAAIGYLVSFITRKHLASAITGANTVLALMVGVPTLSVFVALATLMMFVLLAWMLGRYLFDKTVEMVDRMCETAVRTAHEEVKFFLFLLIPNRMPPLATCSNKMTQAVGGNWTSLGATVEKYVCVATMTPLLLWRTTGDLARHTCFSFTRSFSSSR